MPHPSSSIPGQRHYIIVLKIQESNKPNQIDEVEGFHNQHDIPFFQEDVHIVGHTMSKLMTLDRFSEIVTFHQKYIISCLAFQFGLCSLK